MFTRNVKAKTFKIQKDNHNYLRVVTGRRVEDIDIDVSQFEFNELERLLLNLFEYLGYSELNTQGSTHSIKVFDGSELLLAVGDVAY